MKKNFYSFFEKKKYKKNLSKLNIEKLLPTMALCFANSSYPI